MHGAGEPGIQLGDAWSWLTWNTAWSQREREAVGAAVSTYVTERYHRICVGLCSGAALVWRVDSQS